MTQSCGGSWRFSTARLKNPDSLIAKSAARVPSGEVLLKGVDKMMDCENLKVGDVVFVAARDARDSAYNGEGTVSKVGRKYLIIGNHRYKKENGVEFCGEYSPRFELFPSREAFENGQRADKLRINLAHFLLRGEGFSLAALTSAAEAVGFPLEK